MPPSDGRKKYPDETRDVTNKFIAAKINGFFNELRGFTRFS